MEKLRKVAILYNMETGTSDIKAMIVKKAASLSEKAKKPERGIHSAKHALAKEISEYCHEPKEFAMYLGIIKNIGLRKAFSIFAEIKKSPKVGERGKLFVYKSAFKEKTLRKRSIRTYGHK